MVKVKALALAALAALAVMTGMVFKVNGKVNRLAETVQEMSRQEAEPFYQVPDLDSRGKGWKVTQFGDPEKEQQLCYTITTGEGLVIIDGGCSYEAPLLKEIIGKYQNHVEAWILTHPHPDHINAFLDLYQNMPELTIGRIYTAPHPEIEVMKERAKWDHFESVQEFRNLNVPAETVKAGDVIEVLGGLKIEVLSAYDKNVEILSKDYMNDGSIMFRISGETESMLFCADVGKDMTEYLVETYGDRLKSDYVQMGHHGNGGPDEAFYRKVQPKGAFFDAPASLMTSDTRPSTKEKEALMKEMGCVIYSYYTAPNQILIH